METLIRLAVALGDHNMLLEATHHLRRSPVDTYKYLYEKTRLELAERAYVSLKRVLRAKVDALLKESPANTQTSRLVYLLEMFQGYQSKLKKGGVQPKDDGTIFPGI